MSLLRALQLSAVTALTVLTVVLVVMAMTRTVGATDRQPAGAAATLAGPQAAGDARPVVSVLGDDHVLQEGSWFYRAVPAEPGGTVERGVVLAYDGVRVAELADELGQVAPGDVVLIAAGSNDLARGDQPGEVFRDLRALARGVTERRGVPVLTLLPPSNDRTFRTNLVNRRLRAQAASAGTALLDVHTPVAQPDGRWRPKLTDDGAYADPEGSMRQAEAVTAALPWVLASAGS